MAAVTPRVVDDVGLPGANAARSAVTGVGIVLGPALGGVLLLLGSPEFAFTLNALTSGLLRELAQGAALTETSLQRMLDEDVFGRAYGLALPASVAGIAAASLLAPMLAALLGGPGALVAVGGAVLAYALLVLRGADDVSVAYGVSGADDAVSVVPPSQLAVAGPAPAR